MKCEPNFVPLWGECRYKCDREYMVININGDCVCPSGTVWNDFDQDCREVVTVPDFDCQYYNVEENVCQTDEERILENDSSIHKSSYVFRPRSK